MKRWANHFLFASISYAIALGNVPVKRIPDPPHLGDMWGKCGGLVVIWTDDVAPEAGGFGAFGLPYRALESSRLPAEYD